MVNTAPEAESRASVLRVDDDPGFRRLEARWLGAAGHRCREAASGADALELLATEPADVLVLDCTPGDAGAGRPW